MVLDCRSSIEPGFVLADPVRMCQTAPASMRALGLRPARCCHMRTGYERDALSLDLQGTLSPRCLQYEVKLFFTPLLFGGGFFA
jgi:hypothetical protein